MKKKLLLVLGTTLLVFGLSSCGSKKTLVQVICEESDKPSYPNVRKIIYFWSDGSSDLYINLRQTDGSNPQECPNPANELDAHIDYEYPPVKTP